MLSNVDFPHPLGPTRLWKDPGSSDNVVSPSPEVGEKSFSTAVISTAPGALMTSPI